MEGGNGQGNAKRLKSATGAPISAPRVTAASLPRYQPPNGARVSPNSIVVAPSSASLSRAPPNANPSLKLTVKAPPSKLRQATSGSQLGTTSNSAESVNAYADEPSSSSATPVPAPRGVRSTRNPRKVVEPDSDDDEEIEEEDDEIEIEEDGLGDEDEDEEMEDDEEDAEGDEDDMDAEPHPPPPVIRTHANARGRPSVTVTAPHEGPLKSVEAKEMEDGEDEELSELESGDEVEDRTQNTLLGDEDEEDEELEADEEIDADSAQDSDEDGSRSATPDLSKLTRRQRGAADDFDGGLMALSNEAQKKKHLSAEEHAMRRAEMARRRKNLSEKRNEEEKIDTINKLLKKPAPKRRTRAEIIAAQHAESLGTPGADGEDGEEYRADPVYVRWVNSSSGSRIGVPIEWLEGPVGEALAGSNAEAVRGGRALVEEVS